MMIQEISDRFDFKFDKILITEVTRMTGGLVCVAGIDLKTRRMVRPMQPNASNWEEKKWVASGYFGPGKVVGLEPIKTPRRDFPHANEDKFFQRVTQLGAVNDSDFFSACNETADVDVAAVLGTKLHENKYVEEGADCQSLFCTVLSKNALQLSDAFNKVQVSFNTDHGWYNLTVTDLEVKGAENSSFGADLVRAKIDNAKSHVAIRFGLARPWAGVNGEYKPKRCYLQINGLVGN